MRSEIVIVAILIATVFGDPPDTAEETNNFTTFSVNFDTDGDIGTTEDGFTQVDDNVITTLFPTKTDAPDNYEEEQNETTTEEDILSEKLEDSVATDMTVYAENSTETELIQVKLKGVEVNVENTSDSAVLSESTVLVTNSTDLPTIITVNTTVTNVTKPPPCLNCTTMKTTTDSGSSDDKKASFFSSFNLNYLYFLLLIIPVVGVFVGIFWYCKKKRRTDGYIEPRVQKTKRFSTPSWVFSEPDFQDEEITTLEEEKRH